MAETIQRHMQNLTIDNDPPLTLQLTVETSFRIGYLSISIFENNCFRFHARLNLNVDGTFTVTRFLCNNPDQCLVTVDGWLILEDCSLEKFTMKIPYSQFYSSRTARITFEKSSKKT